MTTWRILTLLVLVGMLATPAAATALRPAAPAEAIDLAAIDNYIEAQMDKHDLRGVSLAILQDGDVLYLKGYGTAGHGRPMTPQTPMFIGSQSKSFTALAIAQLAEQGLVDVNQPVRTYSPGSA